MNLIKSRKAAALVEYGILVGLVAVVSIGSVSILGDRVSTVFEDVSMAMSAVTAPAESPEAAPTPVVLPSTPGSFFDPAGSENYVFGQTYTGEGAVWYEIEGHPEEQAIVDALCVELGYAAPAQSWSFAPGNTLGGAVAGPGYIYGGNTIPAPEAWVSVGSGFSSGPANFFDSLTCSAG